MVSIVPIVLAIYRQHTIADSLVLARDNGTQETILTTYQKVMLVPYHMHTSFLVTKSNIYDKFHILSETIIIKYNLL